MTCIAISTKVPIENVWGIGPQTTAYLTRFGIATALDFARKEVWVRSKLTKLTRISGTSCGERPSSRWSSANTTPISRSARRKPLPRPPPIGLCSWRSSRKRRERLHQGQETQARSPARELFLRTQDFRHTGSELVLSRPTNVPSVIVPLINAQLDTIYCPRFGIGSPAVLSHLRGEGDTQLDLFGEVLQTERVRRIYDGIDRLDAKYGKHTVFLGSSFAAMQGSSIRASGRNFPAGSACCCKARMSGNASAFPSSAMSGNGTDGSYDAQEGYRLQDFSRHRLHSTAGPSAPKRTDQAKVRGFLRTQNSLNEMLWRVVF